MEQRHRERGGHSRDEPDNRQNIYPLSLRTLGMIHGALSLKPRRYHSPFGEESEDSTRLSDILGSAEPQAKVDLR